MNRQSFCLILQIVDSVLSYSKKPFKVSREGTGSAVEMHKLD